MRPIDADELATTFIPALKMGYKMPINAIMDVIQKAPILDEQPVVHAHWVKMSDADGFYYCCGNCGEDLPRYYTEKPTYDNPFPNMESIDKTPRCPYCGAIMD